MNQIVWGVFSALSLGTADALVGSRNSHDKHAAATEQLDKFRPERALQLVRTGLKIAPKTNSFELKFLEGELLRVTGLVSESSAAFENARTMAASDIERCRGYINCRVACIFSRVSSLNACA